MQTDLLSALKAAHLAAYRRDDHEQMNVAARAISSGWLPRTVARTYAYVSVGGK